MDKEMDEIRLKRVVVLGATGTIGKFAVEVIERLEGFELVGISAHTSLQELLKLKKKVPSVKTALTGFKSEKVDYSGKSAVESLMKAVKPDEVIIGISGFSGLKHALTSCKYSKRLCIANKEAIVTGGNFFLEEVKKHSCELIPVDSEHSGIFQLLDREDRDEVEKIMLTASGGALREIPISELPSVTPEMVLKHPVWKMGARITVDSSTMFNKGLEIMEASFLFNFKGERIGVLIHPQGKVHAMIELRDGTLKFQFSESDMRLPIAYAMTYPERVKIFDTLLPDGNMNFYEPDFERYPALKLAYEVLTSGDGARVVYNAADEIAVEAFLDGKLKFTQIYETVYKVLQKEWPKALNSYEEIEAVDRQARRVTREMVKS